jgi:hypothetical protein
LETAKPDRTTTEKAKKTGARTIHVFRKSIFIFIDFFSITQHQPQKKEMLIVIFLEKILIFGGNSQQTADGDKNIRRKRFVVIEVDNRYAAGPGIVPDAVECVGEADIQRSRPYFFGQG